MVYALVSSSLVSELNAHRQVVAEQKQRIRRLWGSTAKAGVPEDVGLSEHHRLPILVRKVHTHLMFVV